MGVEVHEARDHVEAVRIDHLFRFMRLQLADPSDPALLNAEVGLITRQTGAVDYHAASDNDIKLRHDLCSFVKVFTKRKSFVYRLLLFFTETRRLSRETFSLRNNCATVALRTTSG